MAKKIDGRTLNVTGRTQQFSTRTTQEFKDRVKAIAERDGIKIVEFLEQALVAYEGQGRSAADKLNANWIKATDKERQIFARLVTSWMKINKSKNPK